MEIFLGGFFVCWCLSHHFCLHSCSCFLIIFGDFIYNQLDLIIFGNAASFRSLFYLSQMVTLVSAARSKICSIHSFSCYGLKLRVQLLFVGDHRFYSILCRMYLLSTSNHLHRKSSVNLYAEFENTFL